MMNNKGFAVTGFVYTIFIVFIGAMIAILSLFNNRKNILDNLKSDVLKDVNQSLENINNYDTYTTSGSIYEFSAKSKGYYKFVLKTPQNIQPLINLNIGGTRDIL